MTFKKLIATLIFPLLLSHPVLASKIVLSDVVIQDSSVDSLQYYQAAIKQFFPVTVGTGVTFINGTLSTNAAALYVPYTGATGNVDLGTNAISAGTVNVSQSTPTANTVYNLENLNNSTAATLANQQFSPAITFNGQGWATTPSASQSMAFRIYNIPVQGAAAISGQLTIQAATNGGAYTTLAQIGNLGMLSVQGNIVGGNSGTNALAFGTTNGTNFQSYASNLGPINSFPQNLFGSASSVQYRSLLGGAVSTVGITANNSYANTIISASPVTTAATGTHAVLANLSVKSIGTITQGASTVTRTAALYVDGAATATVTDNNYGIYANGPIGFTSLSSGLVKSSSGGLLSNATSGTDYQAPITLTTTGSGAATFTSNVLNVPTLTSLPPSGSAGGDLTGTYPNPTLAGIVTAGTAGSASSVPVLNYDAKGRITGNTNTAIQIAESQVTNLTTDLAGKQATGNYITALTGDGTASGPGSSAFTLATVNANVGTFNNVTLNSKGLATSASNVAYLTGNQSISLTGEATGSGTTSIPVTLTNASVIGKVLTGYVSGAGTVSATDSILSAIQKINGNDALKAPLASPTFTGTVTLPAGQVVNGVILTTGGSSSQFLNGAGSYSTPSAGSGTVTSVSVASANGFAGTVATATTTPAITLSTSITGLLQGNGTAISAATTTGTGPVVLDTAPTITTPNIVGITNASNASSGNVGEEIESTVLMGSAVSLVTGISKNVTSITLTAGDWDVRGNIVFIGTGTTVNQQFIGGINTTSNTLPTPPGAGAYFISTYQGGNGTSSYAQSTGTTRINVSSPITVYLVAQSTFTVSTMTAWGFIGARRIR